MFLNTRMTFHPFIFGILVQINLCGFLHHPLKLLMQFTYAIFLMKDFNLTLLLTFKIS